MYFLSFPLVRRVQLVDMVGIPYPDSLVGSWSPISPDELQQVKEGIELQQGKHEEASQGQS